MSALEWEPSLYCKRRTLPPLFGVRRTPAQKQAWLDQAARVLLLIVNRSHEKAQENGHAFCALGAFLWLASFLRQYPQNYRVWLRCKAERSQSLSSRRKHRCSSDYRHGEAPESSGTRQEVGGSNRAEAGQRLEKAATVQPSWSMGQGLRKFVRGITTNS